MDGADRLWRDIPTVLDIYKRNPKLDEALLELQPIIERQSPIRLDRNVQWKIKRSRFNMLNPDFRALCPLGDTELDELDEKQLDYFWDNIMTINEARVKAKDNYADQAKKFYAFIKQFNMARQGITEMSADVFRENIEEIFDYFEELADKGIIFKLPNYQVYYTAIFKLMGLLKKWSLTITTVKGLEVLTLSQFLDYVEAHCPEVYKASQGYIKMLTLFFPSSTASQTSGNLVEPSFDD